MIPISTLSEKFNAGEEIALSYKFINEKAIQEIYTLIQQLLNNLDQMFLTEVVFTILKEILQNANKANAKRDYFFRNNLDINHPGQYNTGMKNFHEEVTSKWEEVSELMQKANFNVEIISRKEGQELVFEISNNSAIHPEELKRINARIEASKKYQDLSDAFLEMSDTLESAGLGLILTQLLLKNSGIGTERFKISSEGNKTTVRLTIPDQIVPLNIKNKIKDHILSEVEGLPPLPQSLTRLINMCNNPDANLNLVASEIEKNPALSSDLLRLSNSAGFAIRNKVTSIISAVKVVGLKNIQNILYVSGVRKIMEGRSAKLQEVWDHSNMCSFVSRHLAMDAGKPRYSDLASVGGLLHDMGKMVLLSVEKNIFSRINAYKDREQTNSTVIEEISIGISHATLGALLASKWGFPNDLITIIEFHHRPLMAPPEFREPCEIIYLANLVCATLEKRTNFYSIDYSILNKYGMGKIEDFEKYVNKVKTLYEASSNEQEVS